MQELLSGQFLPLWAIPLVLWDLVWKGVGLWKAARNNQQKWFVAILVVNTMGILPIVYLKFFQKKEKQKRGGEENVS